MKSKLLLSLLLVVPIANAQLYPVPESTIDASFIDEKFFAEKVEKFSISELITVKEFNAYLVAMKKDSSATFYKEQLPKSRDMSEEMVKKLLSDPNLQDKPMPGVSWTVARNYCKWLNTSLPKENATYSYDLPYLSELIAFQNLYQKLDEVPLESWTIVSYCENCLEWPEGIRYKYDAKKEDPPAMKRKVYFGGFYHFSGGGNRGESKLFYEYQDSSSRYIGFRIVTRYKNIEEKNLSQSKLTISYGMNANHLNGIYQERYPNGKLKILGTFDNGERVGMWSAWDESGELKVRRNYTNSKQFEFNFPKINNPFGGLYASYPEYKLERKKDQIYPYLYVEERSVLYSQRAWRKLSSTNETALFKNVNFQAVLSKLFESETKWFHYAENGQLKYQLSQDSVKIINQEMKSWDLTRIEVKEDFFFNSENLLGDTRIIAISFYKDANANLPSYSVYYPHVRSLLASFPITNALDKRIANADDYFFFHQFRGEIEMVSNIKTKRIPQDDLKNEIEKFIAEHQLWLDLGR